MPDYAEIALQRGIEAVQSVGKHVSREQAVQSLVAFVVHTWPALGVDPDVWHGAAERLFISSEHHVNHPDSAQNP